MRVWEGEKACDAVITDTYLHPSRELFRTDPDPFSRAQPSSGIGAYSISMIASKPGANYGNPRTNREGKLTRVAMTLLVECAAQ